MLYALLRTYADATGVTPLAYAQDTIVPGLLAWVLKLCPATSRVSLYANNDRGVTKVVYVPFSAARFLAATRAALLASGMPTVPLMLKAGYGRLWVQLAVPTRTLQDLAVWLATSAVAMRTRPFSMGHRVRIQLDPRLLQRMSQIHTRLYFLPKVHKRTCALRPITGARWSLTRDLARWIHHQLQRIINQAQRRAATTVVLESTEACVALLRSLNPLPTRQAGDADARYCVCTSDFSALYTSFRVEWAVEGISLLLIHAHGDAEVLMWKKTRHLLRAVASMYDSIPLAEDLGASFTQAQGIAMGCPAAVNICVAGLLGFELHAHAAIRQGQAPLPATPLVEVFAADGTPSTTTNSIISAPYRTSTQAIFNRWTRSEAEQAMWSLQTHSRYIDDVLCVGSPKLTSDLLRILYPPPLHGLLSTSATAQEVYLDLCISVTTSPEATMVRWAPYAKRTFPLSIPHGRTQRHLTTDQVADSRVFAEMVRLSIRCDTKPTWVAAWKDFKRKMRAWGYSRKVVNQTWDTTATLRKVKTAADRRIQSAWSRRYCQSTSTSGRRIPRDIDASQQDDDSDGGDDDTSVYELDTPARAAEARAAGLTMGPMIQFTLKSLRRCPLLRSTLPHHDAAHAPTLDELRQELPALLAQLTVQTLRWFMPRTSHGASLKLWVQQQRLHKQPPAE